MKYFECWTQQKWKQNKFFPICNSPSLPEIAGGEASLIKLFRSCGLPEGACNPTLYLSLAWKACWQWSMGCCDKKIYKNKKQTKLQMHIHAHKQSTRINLDVQAPCKLPSVDHFSSSIFSALDVLRCIWLKCKIFLNAFHWQHTGASQ